MRKTSKSKLLLLILVSALIAIGVLVAQSAKVERVVTDRARPLPLNAVRLTGGPLKHAQDLDAKYLLELEPDRMLAYYRVRAGLEQKAEPYGGWDGGGRNLTGHIAGHYLSAVSLMWAATGDAAFKERADYIVNEFKEVQDKHGDGYLSALEGGRECFAEVVKGNIRSSGFDLNGEWAPWYTLHKTFAGLRDAYRYTGNRAALDIEIKFAEWADSIISQLDDDQMQRMLNTEFGGMPEVFADLYVDTGDKRWLNLSYRFEHHEVLDPLKKGVDNLHGLHGNTNVPKLIALAVRYGFTGKQEDGVTPRFFWDRVVNHHTFATGGHGKSEYWHGADQLSAIIDGRTAETCNIYNMLKLTRRLFALEPKAEYAQFQERALFNHILGSIDPNDGSTCYMVPVGQGVGREYANMFQSFTCCVGSGMESHALHGDGVYYESGDRLWVNIYAPSTADWKEAGVKLAMETSFPEGDSATATLTLASPKEFTLALRRPAWAGEGFAVKVNGEAVSDVPEPGSYVELMRTWKSGDTVALASPKRLHLEPLKDNPRRAAIMWGPLVMAGDLGPQPERRRGAPRGPRPETPVLVAAEQPVNQWLKPVDGKPGVFQSEGVGRNEDVEMTPFYRLHRRTYAAYWDLFTPTEYTKYAAEIEAERERQRKLEVATVAFVQPGEMQTERDFNMQGEETRAVRSDRLGRPGRGGSQWFSFDLPVTDASGPLALVVTYNTASRDPRSFNVLVEGQKIAEHAFDADGSPRFFDEQYAVSSELVQGKEKVTVRFEATNEQDIAAVFGIRLIRAGEME